jgi:hypothetical protein
MKLPAHTGQQRTRRPISTEPRVCMAVKEMGEVGKLEILRIAFIRLPGPKS